MQCKEWDDANSELFKESHDEAVHKNSYKSRLYELISASLVVAIIALVKKQQLKKAIQWLGRLLSNSKNYERAISLPRMSAVSFYAHYTTENGKDKIEMIPFSAYFP